MTQIVDIRGTEPLPLAHEPVSDLATSRLEGTRDLLLRQTPLTVKLSILVLFGWCVVSIFGRWIAPYGANAIDLNAMYARPLGFGGTTAHLLGTDALGRDILSRLLVGSRLTFYLAVITVVAAGVFGTTLGVVAGMTVGLPTMRRRWRAFDVVIARFTDLMLSVPLILIALLLVVAVGASFSSLLIVLVVFSWPSYARVVRNATLNVCASPYVDLAVLSGLSPGRIAWRHVMPNVRDAIFVVATLQLGYVILLASALDFLGAGIPPPTPTWGGMVADGQQALVVAWWIATIPGIAIMAVVFAANMVGDWLRDVTDPRAIRGRSA